MNAKRLLALLLALVMVFALAACGNSDGKKGEGAQKEAEIEAAEKGEAASYDALVAAVERVYNDADATMEDAIKAAYGADFTAVIMELFDAMKEMGEADEEDLVDVNVLDLDDYEKGDAVKFEVAEAEALTEDEISELQEQAASVSEGMEMVAAFAGMYDEMSEEELADSGVTQDDIAQMKSYIEKMIKIGDYFDDCEIEEGYRLKLNVTVGDDTQEVEKTVVKLNGSWVFADLLDMMA